MYKFLYLAIIFSALATGACGPTHVVVESPAPAAPPPPPPALTYQTFYDALSPYGTWIDNPEYGYVWMPNVGPDFRPYGTNGHWVYTDQGWMWASGYSWGWATFHYGRWFYQDGFGWMWIPGYDWAPAWVSWRRSPEYYGWAPLGPSVTVDVAFGGGYNPPPHYWCFVPQQYVARPQINTYYVSEQQNVTIIQNTTIIRNTTIVNNTVNNTTIVNNNRVTVNNYAGGPDPNEVSRVSGTTIRPVALQETNRPGGAAGGGGLAVYRPRFNVPAQSGTAGASTRPTMTPPPNVQRLNNVRPVNTTVYGNRGVTNTNVTNTTNVNNTTINNNNTTNNTNTNTNINNTNTTVNNKNTNSSTTNGATNNTTNSTTNNRNTTINNQPAKPVTGNPTGTYHAPATNTASGTQPAGGQVHTATATNGQSGFKPANQSNQPVKKPVQKPNGKGVDSTKNKPKKPQP